MRSLSLKLTLLFVAIALVAVGVIALWVNNSMQTEFGRYYQEIQSRNSSELPQQGTGPGMHGGLGMRFMMGAAEQTFLGAFRDSLILATTTAILLAVVLGLLLSRLITGPLRRLTLSAKGITAGDFSQRVIPKSRDEVGQLATAFNTMGEELQRKEQSRRQLLADITHELRTPLSIIQGNLEAWLDGVISPTPEQIASVHDESVLLSRLVTDLRDLSLAEAGQLKLHRTSHDLAELINTELSGISSRAQEKGISISTEVPANLPLVLIDPDRIRQVLHNLIGNALRYTPPDGTIKISAQPGPSEWITVSVADTGTGIHPEDLPHIFNHFYKADRSRHRSGGGSGLGLAIVKQLVEAHGGKVWVESQPDKGSTFHFTLPAD